MVWDGVVNTIAGNGKPGFSGANGPATDASIASPEGLTFSPVGDLVFSDTMNHCLRSVSRYTGIITTLAGVCAYADWGLGGFIDGPAAIARFNTPFGLAYQPGTRDLWVADRVNHRLRVLSAATQQVSTRAGGSRHGWNGDGPALTTYLYEPSGLAWTPDGTHLFFTDSFLTTSCACSRDEQHHCRRGEGWHRRLQWRWRRGGGGVVQSADGAVSQR